MFNQAIFQWVAYERVRMMQLPLLGSQYKDGDDGANLLVVVALGAAVYLARRVVPPAMIERTGVAHGS